MKGSLHSHRSGEKSLSVTSISRGGFTLVELSIVLIVIGLLAAGVLVGRDLIEAAEIRRQAAAITQIDLAVVAFEDKYRCLPGDCAEATDIGLPYNGNGNFVIEVDELIISGPNETGYFWITLGELGFVPDACTLAKANVYGRSMECGPFLKLASQGKYSNTVNPDTVVPPPSIFLRALQEGGETDFDGTVGQHYFWLTGCSGLLAGLENGCAIYSPARTQAIDSKMDDGLPLSGKVVARGNMSSGWIGGPGNATPGPGGPNANRCVSNTTPPTYNVANTSLVQASLCSLTVETTF